MLILTTFDLDEYVLAALRAGASGFLLKDAPGHLVRRSTNRRRWRRAARTKRDQATDRTSPETGPALPELVAGLDRMTDRERQVLVLLARGLSNTEIATRLHLSEATVRTHIGHLFAKIGARDRAQAVVFAYESGIVHPGDPTA